MAGMTVNRLGMSAPGGGYVWDPKKNAYVTPLSQAQETAERAQMTRPQFETDPMGRVHQFMPGLNPDAGGEWAQVGQVDNGAMDGLSRVSRGSAGAGGGAPNPQLAAKLEELWGMGPASVPAAPTFTAPQTPALDPHITPGERAQLTMSKERTGQRLQGALKALNDQAAGGQYRFGSGQHGKAVQALIQQSMGEQNDAELGLLAGRTGRVHDLEDMGYGGAVHAEDQNYGGRLAENEQRVRAQIEQRNRLAGLLSFYGMAY